MLITCALLFLFDPYLYRRLHLTHHAHTNEESDPDRFTASPRLAIRWAKSFLIAGWYYTYCIRRFSRSRSLPLHLCFTPALLVFLWLLFRAAGRTDVLLAGWFVPDFLAIGFLGFVLTAWPHHPGTDTSRMGNAKNLEVPRVLQLLLGHQHLHLVHHYAPTVPWHRLPVYWRENRERLLAKRASQDPTGASRPSSKA
jgi:fatty acid desaturase